VPGRTPLKGKFTFGRADLSVFKGISGILSAHGTFPDYEMTPSQSIELREHFAVPLSVSGYLCPPEFRPGTGKPEQLAVMPVPETPMHKNHRLIFLQNNIRLAG
jgi:hypothetical protein